MTFGQCKMSFSPNSRQAASRTVVSYPLRQGNFDMDKAQGAQTRQAFVDRFGGTNALVIGSHFSDPTSGLLVRDGESWILQT